MPRSWIDAGRRHGPRALIVLALACAEERTLEDACVDCGLHPSGILDPASDDFHGRELARRDWDFPLCAGCHGDDFAGGKSGASCLDCHEDGPTACDTCHDAEPRTGGHPAHLGEGPMERRFECAECHQVPERWDDEGHILRAGAADPSPAEIHFGAAASATPPFAVRDAEPSYAPETGTCAGVYCHGDVLTAGGAGITRPVWTGADQAGCGTCHGVPPASHAPESDCASCHVTGDHIDRELGVAGTCSGCHGDDSSPAPPRDLSGDVLTSAMGVGAHRGHLEADLRLRGPMACADCHQVPAATDSAGHIDTPRPAEVALVGGGDWRRSDATCRSWCHGDSEPVWTRVGQGEVFCGSCHGVPPAGDDHDPDLELTDCAGCHPATVDDFGNILRSGDPGAETSEHMDGDVDL
jgi:predicted CxxxxCH...CXXCH cytochrome family protein